MTPRLCLEQLEDRVVPSSYAITDLASFNGSNGNGPVGGLIQDSSGNLFGTTFQGGANGKGTAFEITAKSITSGSPTITSLASFNGTNGYQPDGVIEDSSGNLFGTTFFGGTNNNPLITGTVFEITANSIASGSPTITSLASFNGSNGSDPSGGLIEDKSGNLFGTTSGGGSTNGGTVFEITANSIASGSPTLTTLAAFNGSNGLGPEGSLIEDKSGNLFGTTSAGGANGKGAVFEITANSIASGSPTITALASFNSSIGTPYSGVIEDSSGNLFGTTEFGGANGKGAVFEITANSIASGSPTITTLVSFNGSNGIVFDDPSGGLIEDSSGNLFGTTQLGGANNDGTVFEITANSIASGSPTITTLASFNGTNGDEPVGGLIVDSSGDVFGTTEGGGANGGAGTVFELTNTVGGTITLSPSTLPSGTMGTAYNQTISASGGSGTLSLSTNPATLSLPAGLSASVSGSTLTISGTPTASGSVTFTVTSSDNNGDTTGPVSYTLNVNAVPPPSAPSPPVPPAPPALNPPPLLAFLDSLLGGTETINADGTATVTDSVFGIPLIVATFDSLGNLEDVALFGIDVTLLFELL